MRGSGLRMGGTGQRMPRTLSGRDSQSALAAGRARGEYYNFHKV